MSRLGGRFLVIFKVHAEIFRNFNCIGRKGHGLWA